MKYIADLHIHSKYSRATSRDLDLEHIDEWCIKKGINIAACADFTHPEWFQELKNKLTETEPGLYQLKKSGQKTRFLLSTEISCIYSKGGKVRRLHIIVFAPSLEIVEKINAQLAQIGNLKADGRPILGLDAKELAKIVLGISPECMVIPAHAWTPWFAVFGSKSGFDSLEECFEEMTPHIYSVETGLSSDPLMNWQLSALDNITLISNSDAHSPANLGREANVFELTKLNYQEITKAIREKDSKKFLYTIEFFPEEGKYHYDGHVTCNVSLSPEETKKHKGICPKCKKPLTVGVLNRVDELADRKTGKKPKNAIPYKSLVPLAEIIAEVFGIGKKSKKVTKEYDNLIKKGGNEFNILLNLSYFDLENITTPEIVEAIRRVREGELHVVPGYDGKYGIVKIFKPEERRKNKQAVLF